MFFETIGLVNDTQWTRASCAGINGIEHLGRHLIDAITFYAREMVYTVEQGIETTSEHMGVGPHPVAAPNKCADRRTPDTTIEKLSKIRRF